MDNNKPTTPPELRECPFCGSSELDDYDYISFPEIEHRRTQCVNCGVEGPYKNNIAWNTRHSPRPLDDGELEGMYKDANDLLIRAGIAEPCLLNVDELGRKTYGNPVLHGLNQVEIAQCLCTLTALHDALARKEGEIERLMGQLNSEVEFDEEGFHNMAQAIRDLEEENQELRIQLRNSGGF